MGYLNNQVITVDAILTKKGRELLAQGGNAFNITQFSLSDDGKYLIAEITVDDSVFLTEPHTFFHRWKKIADRDVIQAPCTMESAKLYLEGG